MEYLTTTATLARQQEEEDAGETNALDRPLPPRMPRRFVSNVDIFMPQGASLAMPRAAGAAYVPSPLLNETVPAYARVRIQAITSSDEPQVGKLAVAQIGEHQVEVAVAI